MPRTLESPKDRPRPPRGGFAGVVRAERSARHAHCERCRESFSVDELGEFALLGAAHAWHRVLDVGCAEQLRRAGEIVDYVGPLE